MTDFFICHAEEDGSIALDIAGRLEQAGYSTWYYERDTKGGIPYQLTIAEAIEQCRVVVVIISEASLNSSPVAKEVLYADDKTKPVVPILNGLCWEEFQARKVRWRFAVGTAGAIEIPQDGIGKIMSQLIDALGELVGPTTSSKSMVATVGMGPTLVSRVSNHGRATDGAERVGRDDTTSKLPINHSRANNSPELAHPSQSGVRVRVLTRHWPSQGFQLRSLPIKASLSLVLVLTLTVVFFLRLYSRNYFSAEGQSQDPKRLVQQSDGSPEHGEIKEVVSTNPVLLPRTGNKPDENVRESVPKSSGSKTGARVGLVADEMRAPGAQVEQLSPKANVSDQLAVNSANIPSEDQPTQKAAKTSTDPQPTPSIGSEAISNGNLASQIQSEVDSSALTRLPETTNGPASIIAPSVITAAGDSDQLEIKRLLDSYVQAFETRDPVRLRLVWPTMQDKQYRDYLGNFKDIQSILMTLQNCSPADIHEGSAAVVCSQSVELKIKGQTESARLLNDATFHVRQLEKLGDRVWIIDHVEYRKATQSHPPNRNR